MRLWLIWPQPRANSPFCRRYHPRVNDAAHRRELLFSRLPLGSKAGGLFISWLALLLAHKAVRNLVTLGRLRQRAGAVTIGPDATQYGASIMLH